MRLSTFCASVSVAALLSACQTTGGGDGPDPFINTPAQTAANLNTTLAPLSFGDSLNFTARDEVFPALTAGLTVFENGPDDATNGFEFVSVTTASSVQTDGVAYRASDNTLTFNIGEGPLSFVGTVGPILFSPPGDDPTLTFDREATYLAAFQDRFPSPQELGITGVDFNPDAFAGDIRSADIALIALSEDTNPDARRYFDALTGVLDEFDNFDFFTYLTENGDSYEQLFLRNSINVNTNFVTLGVWENVATVPQGEPFDFGVTVFGNLSLPEEIPDVGSASYDAAIVGNVLRENEIEALRGTFSLNVNFQTRAIEADVRTSLVVFGVNGENVFPDFVDLSGAGRIGNGNFFEGALDGGTADPMLTGNFSGAFFGPAAAEVGGTFSFTNGAFAASGGFVGPQN